MVNCRRTLSLRSVVWLMLGSCCWCTWSSVGWVWLYCPLSHEVYKLSSRQGFSGHPIPCWCSGVGWFHGFSFLCCNGAVMVMPLFYWTVFTYTGYWILYHYQSFWLSGASSYVILFRDPSCGCRQSYACMAYFRIVVSFSCPQLSWECCVSWVVGNIYCLCNMPHEYSASVFLWVLYVWWKGCAVLGWLFYGVFLWDRKLCDCLGEYPFSMKTLRWTSLV